MSKSAHWSPERILALRKDLALTQEQLSAILGVSSLSVSRWERSLSSPSRLACRALFAISKEGTVPH